MCKICEEWDRRKEDWVRKRFREAQCVLRKPIGIVIKKPTHIPCPVHGDHLLIPREVWM